MAELYTMSAIKIETKLQVFTVGELGAFGFPQSENGK